MLSRNLSMLGAVLKNDGAMACTECFVRRLGHAALGMDDIGQPRTTLMLFRATDFIYDSIHGTNTGGVIDLPEMEGNGRNYIATPPRAWKLLLRKLPINPAEFTYFDLGCGKGRTLLLAAEAGFRRVIGVDIASQLLGIARENMERKRTQGELICRDVRELEFPNEPLVVFMYNPFFDDVMRQVALNLEDSIRRRPREVYVIYYSAAFPDAWTGMSFSVMRSSTATYPNFVIYRAGAKSADATKAQN